MAFAASSFYFMVTALVRRASHRASMHRLFRAPALFVSPRTLGPLLCGEVSLTILSFHYFSVSMTLECRTDIPFCAGIRLFQACLTSGRKSAAVYQVDRARHHEDLTRKIQV